MIDLFWFLQYAPRLQVHSPMKLSVILGITVIAVFCFIAGYGSASLGLGWNIPDVLIGTFLGGLITLSSAALTSHYSKETSMRTLRLSHELEVERERRAVERESAGKALRLLSKLSDAAAYHGSHGTDSRRIEEVFVHSDELGSLVATVYPELETLVFHFRREFRIALTKTLEESSKSKPAGRLTTEERAAFVRTWGSSEVLKSAIHQYIVLRYVKSLNAEVPVAEELLSSFELKAGDDSGSVIVPRVGT